MKRILVVSTSFPLTSSSNSGIFVKRLTDSLHTKAYVEVVTPDGTDISERFTPYTVHAFRYAPKSWQVLAHNFGGIPVALKTWPLCRLLVPLFLIQLFLVVWKRSAHFDVIFANWSMTGLVCGLVGLIRGLPVCTVLRGDDVSNLKKSKFKGIVLWGVLKLNSFVVCVSEEMQMHLRTLYSACSKKILFIPNGVDDNLLCLAYPLRKKSELRLLYVGSLIPRKRLDTVLKAIARLDSDVLLSIVGDGAERPRLCVLTNKLGLGARVTFYGSRPASEIPIILDQHDALVLASVSEGRPNVVMEAMAAGRVVICTRLPGTVELIDHRKSGFLFCAGNFEELSACIDELKSNYELFHSVAMSARQTILKRKLSWSVCSDKYLEVFQSSIREF